MCGLISATAQDNPQEVVGLPAALGLSSDVINSSMIVLGDAKREQDLDICALMRSRED